MSSDLRSSVTNIFVKIANDNFPMKNTKHNIAVIRAAVQLETNACSDSIMICSLLFSLFVVVQSILMIKQRSTRAQSLFLLGDIKDFNKGLPGVWGNKGTWPISTGVEDKIFKGTMKSFREQNAPATFSLHPFNQHFFKILFSVVDWSISMSYEFICGDWMLS